MKRPLPPPLTRHLSRLRLLARRDDERPMFDDMDDAVEAAAEESRATGIRHVATPVWRIDHDAIEDSVPVAWSWSRVPV